MVMTATTATFKVGRLIEQVKEWPDLAGFKGSWEELVYLARDIMVLHETIVGKETNVTMLFEKVGEARELLEELSVSTRDMFAGLELSPGQVGSKQEEEDIEGHIDTATQLIGEIISMRDHYIVLACGHDFFANPYPSIGVNHDENMSVACINIVRLDKCLTKMYKIVAKEARSGAVMELEKIKGTKK